MCVNPNRQAKARAVVFFTVFAASQIHAQTANEDQLWELSVGAKVAYYPKYMGSKNSETLVLPLIEGYMVLGESTTLFSSDFTLGLDWQITQPISTGLLATGRLGRDSSCRCGNRCLFPSSSARGVTTDRSANSCNSIQKPRRQPRRRFLQ